MRRVLIAALSIFFFGYLVICLGLFLRQDSLIFFPRHEDPRIETASALARDFEPWIKDGIAVGWQSRNGDPRNVLLVLHGNAGTALDRTRYASFGGAHVGWKTCLLEYPGYGSRPGRPSEKTLTDSAVDAVRDLAADPERRIWLLGESLGSGVACATAAQTSGHLAGVILVSPFDSFVGAAAAHYPWIPVSVLLRTRLDSMKHLAAYPGPVAFVSGALDPVVPLRLAQKLYDHYPGRKRLWIAPAADHDVSDFLALHWREIVDWLQSPP